MGKRTLLGFTGMSLTVASYAQDASAFITEAETQIRLLVTPIYSVVMTIIFICALASLTMIIVKMNSADQNSANKAIAWCGGLLFCIVAAVVLKTIAG